MDLIMNLLSLLFTVATIYVCYYVSKRRVQILMLLGKKYILARTNYIWKIRADIPYNTVGDIVANCADKIFGVDPDWAELNTSHDPRNRISIENAYVASHEQEYLNVTKELRSLWEKYDVQKEDSLFLGIFDIFEMLGYIHDRWRLHITYKGHSNPLKKTEAGTYSVVYDLKLDSKISINFPPYPIDEPAKIGFSAPKVRSVEMDHEENKKNPKFIEMARKSAGLRCNFYNDCVHDSVVKNYMEEDAVVKTNKASFVVGRLI